MLLLCVVKYPIVRRLGIFDNTMESGCWKRFFLNEIFWDYEEGSTCLLIWIYSYFVPFEIYVYIIFWNIIYSLQEMNSTTVWGSWCTSLSFGCFVLLSFLFLLATKTCACFWEFNMALTIEDQLQVHSWNLRHRNYTGSRASFCFYQMVQGSTLSCFIAFNPVRY